MPRWHTVQLLFVACYFASAVAQVNVTVDDNDPRIVYTGNWGVPQPPIDLDAGGTHHLGEEIDSLATFTFTGETTEVTPISVVACVLNGFSRHCCLLHVAPLALRCLHTAAIGFSAACSAEFNRSKPNNSHRYRICQKCCGLVITKSSKC